MNGVKMNRNYIHDHKIKQMCNYNPKIYEVENGGGEAQFYTIMAKNVPKLIKKYKIIY